MTETKRAPATKRTTASPTTNGEYDPFDVKPFPPPNHSLIRPKCLEVYQPAVPLRSIIVSVADEGAEVKVFDEVVLGCQVVVADHYTSTKNPGQPRPEPTEFSDSAIAKAGYMANTRDNDTIEHSVIIWSVEEQRPVAVDRGFMDEDRITSARIVGPVSMGESWWQSQIQNNVAHIRLRIQSMKKRGLWPKGG